MPASFDPNFAPYFATSATPPLTAAYGRLLSLAVAYRETLLAIGDGRPLDYLQHQAEALAKEAAVAASLVIPGAGAAAAAFRRRSAC